VDVVPVAPHGAVPHVESSSCVALLQLQMIGRRRRRGGASFLVAASVTTRLDRLQVEAMRVSTSFCQCRQTRRNRQQALGGARCT
jgi:hypothetical protein